MIINFKKLFNYKVFKDEKYDDDIFNKIKDLIEMIEKGKLEFFGNHLRKTLESILFLHDSLPSPEKGIFSSVNSLKNQDILIPTNILDGLYLIKNLSNRESHSPYKKENINFKIEITNYEAESAIRNLWLIIKWILVDINGVEEVAEFKYKNGEGLKKLTAFNPQLNNQNDDMQPEKISISNLLMVGEYKFNIPTYQRDYTWDVKKNKNILKLLNDIKMRSKDNKNHYFGSLAIAIDEDKKIFRIIDGQQRLTTSLIVLKAFYDAFVSKGSTIQKELSNFINKRISSIYLNAEVLSSQRAVKLLLDNRFDPSESRLPRENYEYILETFTKLSNEELLSYYTTFLMKFEVVTLVFKTTIENEMDIFENLNTGGTKLEDWDLIRSFIFSRMDPNSFLKYERESNTFINRTFVAPLNIKNKGNHKAQMSKFISIYVRYILAVTKKRTISNEPHIEFKNSWPNQEKFTQYEEWQKSLDTMHKAFNTYVSFKFEYKESTSNPFHAYHPILDLINSKDDLMPIILNVAIKEGTFNENNELIKINKKIVKVLMIMESYLIRSNTFGKNFNEQYDSFLINNYEDVSNKLWDFYKNKIPEKMVSLDRFCSELENNGNLLKSKIMNITTRIELKLRNIAIGETGYIKFEKSHEHIISQSLPYESYDDQSKSEEEFELLLEEHKNYIGNALILSRGANSKASNKKFIDKIEVYKNSSYSAKGSFEEPKLMNLINKKIFTFDDIKIRSKQIAEFIKESKIYYEEK